MRILVKLENMNLTARVPLHISNNSLISSNITFTLPTYF